LKYPRGSKELDQFDCCIVVLLSARMDQSSMHQKLDPMQNEIVQDFPLLGGLTILQRCKLIVFLSKF